ncbi:hypothetical protein K503DRAFT_22070 [Rhizopogon vinicolor AM-OR11-026]|uniref:Uncharacterized protein n=1 Tax=Rhizopogon vinicolor AM-OR11-026 TaxID=1314800 RepID=A0A1B7MHJ3_9AGAM|nr:hypothetical protein K503DRAFT_22070 [Rhizopogon vinicolor AM-OR11-026]
MPVMELEYPGSSPYSPQYQLHSPIYFYTHEVGSIWHICASLIVNFFFLIMLRCLKPYTKITLLHILTSLESKSQFTFSVRTSTVPTDFSLKQFHRSSPQRPLNGRRKLRMSRKGMASLLTCSSQLHSHQDPNPNLDHAIVVRVMGNFANCS